MAEIIAITNQKGGVGKTTTAINLAACLGEAEQRVLLVDFDPQGNASTGVTKEDVSEHKGIYELLCGLETAEDCIVREAAEGVDLLPSNIDLSGAEVELQGAENMEGRLKAILDGLRGDYDYILIDCPPSLSVLTVHALTAADSVIIPVQCEYYALEGLHQVLNTIYMVRQRLNPALRIRGILYTMYDQRTNLSQQVVEAVTDGLSERSFKTLIPRNVKLAEAPSYGEPINVYDRYSRGTESYRQLAAEILEDRG